MAIDPRTRVYQIVGTVTRLWKPVEDSATAIVETVADFGKGVVIDAPVATAEFLWHISADTTRYVLGIDHEMGEGRDREFSEWSQKFWSAFDATEINPLSLENPVLGPVSRAADVALSLGLGAIDMFTAHTVDYVTNNVLELDIAYRYFHPGPTTARAMGEEIGMLGLMLATPAVKTRAAKTLKMMPKSEPISESPAFRNYLQQQEAEKAAQAARERPAPKFVPAFGVLGVWPTVAALFDWVFEKTTEMRQTRTRRVQEKLRGELQAVPREEVNRLVEAAKRSPAAIKALGDLAAAGHDYARMKLFELVRQRNPAAIEAAVRAAQRDSIVAQRLCQEIGSMDATGRLQLQAELMNLDCRTLARLARTELAAVYALDMLADMGNEAAHATLAALDVRHWVRELKQWPHPRIIQALFLAAQRGNRDARLALHYNVNLPAAEREAFRSDDAAEALGFLAEVGTPGSRVALGRVAASGRKAAQRALERLDRLDAERARQAMGARQQHATRSAYLQSLTHMSSDDLLATYRAGYEFDLAKEIARRIEARDASMVSRVRSLPIGELTREADLFADVIPVLERFAEAGHTGAFDALADRMNRGDVSIRRWMETARSDVLQKLAEEGVVDAAHMLQRFAQHRNRPALAGLVAVARGLSPAARVAGDLLRLMEVNEIASTTRQSVNATSTSALGGDMVERLDDLTTLASFANVHAVRALLDAWDKGNRPAASRLLNLDANAFVVRAMREPAFFDILKELAKFQNQSAITGLGQLLAEGSVQAGEALLAATSRGGTVLVAHIADAFVRAAEKNSACAVWFERLLKTLDGAERSMASEIIGRYIAQSEDRLVAAGLRLHLARRPSRSAGAASHRAN